MNPRYFHESLDHNMRSVEIKIFSFGVFDYKTKLFKQIG